MPVSQKDSQRKRLLSPLRGLCWGLGLVSAGLRPQLGAVTASPLIRAVTASPIVAITTNLNNVAQIEFINGLLENQGNEGRAPSRWQLGFSQKNPISYNGRRKSPACACTQTDLSGDMIFAT